MIDEFAVTCSHIEGIFQNLFIFGFIWISSRNNSLSDCKMCK